jgi:hypothetical protein
MTEYDEWPHKERLNMPNKNSIPTDAEKAHLKNIRTHVKDARAKLRDVKKRAQTLWRKSLSTDDEKRQTDILSKIKKS